jgi:tetratricopeptide (TPR) repeat protein/transcriptional regulator with XRE-family HTH domain
MTKSTNEANRNELFIIERKQHRWTQSDVAEKLAAELGPSDMVDVRTIKRWESGKSNPSPHHLRLLEKLFGRRVEELGFVDEGKIPFWNISQYYTQNPLFTGRESILAELHDLFTTQTVPDAPFPPALTGLPGIGKTQIAVEYCYRYKYEYQTIAWLSADTQEVLLSRFEALAQFLNLSQKEKQDQNKIKIVKKWFSERKRWLLIFDNIDDLEMIHDFIPSPCHGHIILTTRSQSTGRFARQISVGEWTPQEGAHFLLKRAKVLSPLQEDYKKAEEISEELSGLPLALDQAGDYIENAAISLVEYATLYQKHGKKLREQRGRYRKIEYPDSVASVFSLTFKKIRDTNPDAFELLKLFAFLHPESIPEEIIREGDMSLNPMLQTLAHDPVVLDNAIAELRTASLVRRNPVMKVCALHRLVQDVLQDTMDTIEKKLYVEYVVHAVSHIFPDGQFENWSQCDRLLSQAQICSIYIEQWNMVSAEAAQLLDYLGTYFCLHAQYDNAEKLYSKALAMREQLFGQTHPDVAQSCNHLGHYYYFQYRDDLSLKFYKRALQINESIFGPTHYSLVQTLYWTSRLYTSSDLEQAERASVRARSILEQVPEEKEKGDLWGKIISNLGFIYYKQRKYEEAEYLLKDVLQTREKLKGLDHPDIAIDHKQLGLLYSEQKRYKEAEQHFKQSLKIRKKALGSLDLAVSESLYCLAKNYQEQDRYKEAEIFYKRAFAIVKKVVGTEHPFMAEYLKEYAELLREMERISEAEEVEERVKAIQARHKN